MAAPILTVLAMYLHVAVYGRDRRESFIRAVKDSLPVWVVVVSFWILRATVLGKFLGGYADKPLEASSLLNMFEAAVSAIWVLALNTKGFGGLGDLAGSNIVLALFWVALVVVGALSLPRGPIAVALVWLALGLLPIIHLMLPYGLFKSRFLYFPGAGVYILAGYLAAGLWHAAHKSRALPGILARTSAAALIAASVFAVSVTAFRAREICSDFQRRSAGLNRACMAVSSEVKSLSEIDRTKLLWVAEGFPNMIISVDVFAKVTYPELLDRLIIINGGGKTSVAVTDRLMSRLKPGLRFSDMHFNNPESYGGYVTTGVLDSMAVSDLGKREDTAFIYCESLPECGKVNR
jgi:hypothetical protein